MGSSPDDVIPLIAGRERCAAALPGYSRTPLLWRWEEVGGAIPGWAGQSTWESLTTGLMHFRTLRFSKPLQFSLPLISGSLVLISLPVVLVPPAPIWGSEERPGEV